MKTLIYTLSLAALFSLASCELETSSHGDLYAFWHLERIDSVNSGTQTDMKSRRLFWSFQGKLLELDDKDAVLQSVLMRFEQSGGSLRVYNPYLYNREEGDEPIADTAPLAPFGINQLDETFTIETLKSGKMTLRSSTVRLHFKQF